MILMILMAVLLGLLLPARALFNVISFAKQLYIPGQYFSLMNFSKNTQPLQNYYDVRIDYTLAQAMFADQGNSIFDFFLFQKDAYEQMEPCYYQTVVYLNNLYQQFQPCQGGCNSFEATSLYGINSTYLDLSGEQYDNLSLIVDNTFFPCNGGVYQSEVYLYQVLNLAIESNASYLFVIKLVFVILLQVFIFLFAYIVIMLQKLQSKKKRLKKLKQEEEDQEVLCSLERDRENH